MTRTSTGQTSPSFLLLSPLWTAPPQVAQTLSNQRRISAPLSLHQIRSHSSDRSLSFTSSVLISPRLSRRSGSQHATPTATTFPYTGFRRTLVKGEGRSCRVNESSDGTQFEQSPPLYFFARLRYIACDSSSFVIISHIPNRIVYLTIPKSIPLPVLPGGTRAPIRTHQDAHR